MAIPIEPNVGIFSNKGGMTMNSTIFHPLFPMPSLLYSEVFRRQTTLIFTNNVNLMEF